MAILDRQTNGDSARGPQEDCEQALVPHTGFGSEHRIARQYREERFKTKPEIALDQIHAACQAGLPRGVVLMDAGYGANTQLRTDIST